MIRRYTSLEKSRTEKLDNLRDYISEYIQHSNSLLFNRLHYFLLATAFLFSVLVTIINSDRFAFNPTNNLWWVGLVIVITGFSISNIFTMANFLNSSLIFDTNVCLRDLGKSSSLINNKAEFHEYLYYNLVPKHRFSSMLLLKTYFHAITFIPYTNIEIQNDAHLENIVQKDVAPHTWLIPSFITFVWFIIGSIVFAPWPANIFIIFSFIGLVIISRVMLYDRCTKEIVVFVLGTETNIFLGFYHLFIALLYRLVYLLF